MLPPSIWHKGKSAWLHDLLALRLTSELVDLRAANANLIARMGTVEQGTRWWASKARSAGVADKKKGSPDGEPFFLRRVDKKDAILAKHFALENCRHNTLIYFIINLY